MLRRPPDTAIPASRDDAGGEGLEGLPRADAALIAAVQPALFDAALAGPVVLTRHGHDAFVLLPVDQFQRLLLQAAARRLPGPPVIEPE
ncbi:MAG: type II toxin-antitoxin system Phd/YefM family antitoxin [Rhodovarius sp.]|nr:type II toxin-antitoxin system Phd/YefM family antitoxin [Rhodovarius sp.]MDW8313692.1 type II toxin-antitoxin system Phd/YefM family antitoxin [Rhodovarius sp.]